MNNFVPPFDDTVLLDDMPVPITESDTAPIVENEENGHAVANVPDTEAVQPSGSGISRVTSYITVATLLVINLLNYMDRYTVSGKIVVEE